MIEKWSEMMQNDVNDVKWCKMIWNDVNDVKWCKWCLMM